MPPKPLMAPSYGMFGQQAPQMDPLTGAYQDPAIFSSSGGLPPSVTHGIQNHYGQASSGQSQDPSPWQTASMSGGSGNYLRQVGKTALLRALL